MKTQGSARQGPERLCLGCKLRVEDDGDSGVLPSAQSRSNADHPGRKQHSDLVHSTTNASGDHIIMSCRFEEINTHKEEDQRY